MGIVKWKTNSSGDFNTTGNWSPAQIPTTTDDVEIDVPGAVTVTSSASNTVDTLETTASVTLAIIAGTFSINSGSGPGGLNGTIAVNGNATLFLGGNVVNTGTIKLGSSTADTGVLRISSALMTLQGGGTIALSNNASNLIYGNSGSFTLNNVDNIIAGAGQLGDGQMTLVNSGQVVANQTIALVLDTGNFVKNTGILKSTNTAANTGGLVIANTSVDNSGKGNAGKIEAIGANTHVDLQNSTILGGTLITSGGGVIQTIANNSATLDGVSAGAPITNKGTVLVKDTSALTLDGVINNMGVIRLASTVDNTRIVLGSQTVTLQGGGSLTLSDSANNFIYGNSGLYQLINVDNMISGAGQLGNGQLSLVNQGSGVIDANQKIALVLNGGGGGAQTINNGLLEDTGTGGLVLNNTIDNGGTIKAVGAGAHVDLSGTYIEGGTLMAAAGGTIRTVNGSSTLDGVTAGALTIVGSVTITDQTALYLAGTINNTGTIALAGISTTGVTDLRLNSQTVTLQGHGKVTLSNDGNNRIYGVSGSYQLINMNNTISGAGQLGANQIELTNEKAGVINANQKTALILYSSDIVNNGLMEGTGAGGLMIFNSTVDNALGKIIANGKGAGVTLAGGSIEGGTITTANGGVIQTAGNGNLDGFTAGGLENTGTVLVSDNTSLSVEGYILNTGTIKLGSGVDQTNLIINNQRVVLKGGGSVTLTNSAVNRIYGSSGYNQLINMDNTISGAGQLGAGQLTLVNQLHGKIIANQRIALTVSVGGMLIDNAGLMECTSTGGLVINNSTIDNSGGTIAAIGKATHVDLAGATIEGGTLKTTTGGVIQTVSNGGNLDGVTAGVLINAGTLKVTDGTSLTLEGVINNTGTINLAAASTNNTNFILNGETVTLQGKGKIVLSNFAANRIYGANGVFTLNNLGNTIVGGGQIGAGQMQLNNGGTIEATGTAGMNIALGSGIGTNMASGLMEATGTGGMTFSAGYISNIGRIVALNGSSVTFNGASVSNNLNGVLTGGIWSAISTGQAATLSVAGGAVTDDAATITLSGAKSVFQGGNNGSFTTLELSLTTIDTNGALQLLNARSYTTTLNMGVSGTLQLAGGAFKAHSLALTSTGKILGFGTVTDAVGNAGLVDAKGGALDVTNAVTGAGKLAIEAGASLKLDDAVAASESLNFAGANSKLILTDGAAFAATISTFGGATESIDLTTVAFNSGTALTYSTTSHILNATDGTHSASLKLFQQYVASGFHEASDGHGGTLITYIQPSAHEPAVVAAHH